MFIATGRGISGISNTFTPNAANANPTYTIGIYRSTNEGVDWEPINDGLMIDYEQGGFIRRILANPNDANILFAVGTSGVHRSMNALSPNPTWQKVFDSEPGIEQEALLGLEFKPNDPNTIYVSGNEIYKSTDNGDNWILITGASTGLDIDNLNNLDVSAINIAVTPDNPSTVIAYTQGKENGVGLGKAYLHKYNGSNWTQLHTWQATVPQEAIDGRAAIAVSEIDEMEIYVGTTKLYGTSNSVNFNYLNGYNVHMHADVQSIEFFPNPYEHRMLIGTDGGISECDPTALDPSLAFTLRQKGLGVSTSWGFDVSDFDENRIVVGNQDCGTYKYDLLSTYPWYWLYGGDGYGTQFNHFNADQLFVKGSGTDDFKSFNYISNSATNEYSFLPYDPIETGSKLKPVSSFRSENHPRTGNWYAGFTEILERKIDEPATGTPPLQVWEIKSNLGSGANIADPSDDIPWSHRQMLEFKIASSDPNYMYCSNLSIEGPGTGNDLSLHFFRTTTGGCDGDFSYACFDEISGNLPTGTVIPDFVPVVTGIDVDPKDPEHLWVSISGYQTGIKILESYDAGDNWTSADPNNSLPNLPMNGIVHQQGSNGTLYIATDVGVYIRPTGDTDWQKYGDIPNVRVTNLEINYCSEKIFAGTYGRGIWSIPLYEFNRKYDSFHIVEESDIWDKNVGLAHNLKILDGVTLTITGVLSMPSNARIEVQAGGKLIVNGGKITNNCGKLWNGIYVEGSSNGQGSPNYAGKVGIYNGAEISYARSALNNFILTESGANDWNSTGGRIQSYGNCIFKNNKRDAQFLTYQNLNSSGGYIDDYSFFNQASFIIDDDYIESEGVESDITIYRCEGIKIRGCNFLDSRSGIPLELKRTGVLSSKSSVKVDQYCGGLCNPGIPNTFITMNKGVYIIGDGSPLFKNEVKNSNFISCWRGVYLFANSKTEVWLNDFEVTPSLTSNGTDGKTPVGIYLHKKVRDYHIEGNKLYPVLNSTGLQSGYSIGIVANTGLGNNEQIYRNEFKHLLVGFESIGKNKINSGFIHDGLRLKCNNFFGDRSDIFIAQGNEVYPQYGIARDQGFDAENLAFNTFEYNPILRNIDNDIYDINGNINYRYSNGVSDEYPGVVFDIGSNVFLFGVNTTIPQNQKCPTEFDVVDVQIAMDDRDNARISKEQKELEMSQVIDGGDTENWQNEVALTDNSEAWEQYLSLMSKSGYISEEVMKEMIINENGFNAAMTRNVLVANKHAAKSEELSDALDARVVPLPAYMREQINLGLSEMSPKDFLQLQKDRYKFDQDKAIRTVYQTLLSDSIPADNLITMVQVLTGNNDIRYDYKLVELYDAMGQEYLSDALLGVMSNYELSETKEQELNRYIDFRLLMRNWKDNDKDELALLEEDLQVLDVYAAHDDIAGAEAVTLLLLNNALVVEEPVFFPDEDKSIDRSKPKISHIDVKEEKGKLSLYPNPAKNFFTLDYQIKVLYDHAFIRIVDAQGRELYKSELKNNQDQIIIDTSQQDIFNSGLYQCEILLDGNPYLSEAIVIK